MIVCKQCGHHNEDGDQFCGSCGVFLEWHGERIATAPVAPEAPPEPVAHDKGLLERVREAVVRDRPPAPAAPVGAPSPPPVTAPSPGGGRPGAPPPPPPVGGRTPPAPVPPAPVPPAPVAPPPGPGAQKPTESVRPAGPVATPAPMPAVVRPGEYACHACGVGNAPDRRFCRSCGTELQLAAEPAPKRGWFRRRPKQAPAAGTRPDAPRRRIAGGGRAVRRIVVAVLAVAVLLGVGPLRPSVSDVINKGLDLVSPRLERAAPTEVTASSQTPDGEARLALDTARNTSWVAASPEPGQRLELRLSEVADVERVEFLTGVLAADADYSAFARPRQIAVTFLDADGNEVGARTTAELKDDKGRFQVVGASADGVSAVRIDVLTVYPPVAGQGGGVAIAEVNVFERRPR